MPEITDEQFSEYEQLKRWAKREMVFKSAKEITKLEDDIDKPIKNCVAMFALLGCQPFYSCCGFDYSKQPFHKSHQYGRPYIMLSDSERTAQILEILSRQKTVWYAEKGAQGYVNLQVMAGMNPHWRKEECIHFAEECVISIKWLECFLVVLKSGMLEEVVIEDTNLRAKKDLEYWQYPPKEPWVILRSEVFEKLTTPSTNR